MTAGMFVFDYSKHDVMVAWEDECVNVTQRGYVDGCFSDRMSEGTFAGVDKTVLKEWNVGHIQALQVCHQWQNSIHFE
jgi:hypothetical protein